MNHHHKRRIYYIAFFLTGSLIATGLILYALKQNINVFLTPQEVSIKQIESGETFRLGGLVKPGSIKALNQKLSREFILTDQHKEIFIQFEGSLPDLFREGKGAVVTGKFQANGRFIASQVLAKHDENYMPPKVAKALSKQDTA